jgi:hypothetical protein
MNKKLVIGIIAGVVVLGGVGIFLYMRKKKKLNKGKEGGKQGIANNVVTSEGKEEVATIEKVEPEPNYDGNQAIKTLKEDIGKGYYTMEIICPVGDGTAKHCETGGKYSDGLVQGVWIQMKRGVKRYRDKMNTATSDSKVRAYGEKLLGALNTDIDKKFDPKFFNTNMQWYKDYLAKGGKGI